MANYLTARACTAILPIMPMLKAQPDFEIQTSVSQRLYDLLPGGRFWNVHARAALYPELEKHFRERIPQHFKVGAKSVYGYLPRLPVTLNMKERVWRRNRNQDLVRSGITEQGVTHIHQITFGGSFGGPMSTMRGPGFATGGPGTLQGRLRMFLPKTIAEPRLNKKTGVTGKIGLEEIRKEITATTPAEREAIASGYRNRLITIINTYHGPMRLLNSGGRYGPIWVP